MQIRRVIDKRIRQTATGLDLVAALRSAVAINVREAPAKSPRYQKAKESR